MHRFCNWRYIGLLVLWLQPLSAPAIAIGHAADRILADEFTLQGITAVQPRRADGGYDWDWRGPRNDPEWAWFFNRHDWFMPLLAAYQQTRADPYAEFLLDALDDWIQTHPPPRGFTISSAWRPLEAARRILGSWPEVLAVLGDHPAFTEERRQRFLQSMQDHGHHLRHQHVFFGNHLITEVLALTHLALLLPEAAESAEWLAYGLSKLDESYRNQVYPDGAHKELSTHYQRVIALNYQKLHDLLIRHGKASAAAVWAARVDHLWRYLASVMQPDGTNPINNDSDREFIRHLLATHAPDLLTLEPQTRLFPWAGHVVFRSQSRSGEALWAWFDAGPRGSDHDHTDALQFSLSVDNAHFLTDPGRYTYAPGPFRRYFAGPSGHNLILLDGVASAQGPRWVTRPDALLGFSDHLLGIDIAWGQRSFALDGNPRAADWSRSVIHLHGTAFVVVDRLVLFTPRQLTALWHSTPEIQLRPTPPAAPASGAVPALTAARMQHAESTLHATLYRSGAANLPWRESWIRGKVDPQPQGWFSPDFNQRLPAPAWIVELAIDAPTVLVWIFQLANSPPIQPAWIATDQVRFLLPESHSGSPALLNINLDNPTAAQLNPQ